MYLLIYYSIPDILSCGLSVCKYSYFFITISYFENRMDYILF